MVIATVGCRGNIRQLPPPWLTAPMAFDVENATSTTGGAPAAGTARSTAMHCTVASSPRNYAFRGSRPRMGRSPTSVQLVGPAWWRERSEANLTTGVVSVKPHGVALGPERHLDRPVRSAVDELIDMGVDGIITNFPACLLAIQGRLHTDRLTPAGGGDAPSCR